jgi:hypothetical protein
MATAAQLPGVLNIAFRSGDFYSTLVDFSISTTGYTWTSQVYSLLTGETVATPSVTVVDAENGKVSVGMTASQTAVVPHGTYGWRLTWTSGGTGVRTALDGVCEVLA